MVLKIELPPEIEAKLREWSRVANQSEDEIVCQALESYLAIPPGLRYELEAWQRLGAEAIERVAPHANETW